MSTIAIPQGDFTLKLDTGAEAKILPIATYNKLSLKPPLKPTDVKLTAYGGTSLSPLGTLGKYHITLYDNSIPRICPHEEFLVPSSNV